MDSELTESVQMPKSMPTRRTSKIFTVVGTGGRCAPHSHVRVSPFEVFEARPFTLSPVKVGDMLPIRMFFLNPRHSV